MQDHPFDRFAAATALNALGLSALNRELADVWLALWQGGNLPARGAISPKALVKFLPGLAIMDIHAGGRVRFRIAGKSFRAAFGFDPSSHDMLALTPPAQRKARFERCVEIVEGTVSTGIRTMPGGATSGFISQDVMLPLGGVAEDGARSWLFHSSWRPRADDWARSLPQGALGMIDSYTAHALR
ncbi:MAG TPA: PAS domain-containing protein [Rhizomicrobium sp.]|jgi:hypothetical protein|nr:PAS domain-containing protein [Rhizomicrobium sp.]